MQYDDVVTCYTHVYVQYMHRYTVTCMCVCVYDHHHAVHAGVAEIVACTTHLGLECDNLLQSI